MHEQTQHESRKQANGCQKVGGGGVGMKKKKRHYLRKVLCPEYMKNSENPIKAYKDTHQNG